MPYNSQSPLILKLNQFFSDPQANAAPRGSDFLRQVDLSGNPVHKLSDRAKASENDIATAREGDHLDGWPQDHQELLRWVLIHSIDEDIPMSFAWEEVQNSNQTRTVIVSFDGRMGVTCRSPYYLDVLP